MYTITTSYNWIINYPNHYLLDFFVTINDKPEDFEEQIHKGQMDYFCNSKVNNSKIETYNSYALCAEWIITNFNENNILSKDKDKKQSN